MKHFKIIYDKRIFIACVAFCAALAAAIATSKFFLPPVFSSETIFYPPTAAISRNFDIVKSFMVQDKEIEEHLQTILSGTTEETIIKKYNLVEHYKIDTSEVDWRDELKEEWQENFKVSRTKYNSISIKITDIDNLLASEIANDAVRVSDSIKSTLLKNNLKQNYASLALQLAIKFSEVDSTCRQLGLSPSQVAFAPSLTGNSSIDLAQKQNTLAGLINKGNFALQQPKVYELASLLRQLYDLESTVSQLNMAIASPPLSSFILTPAQPSYKKSSPQRTLITIGAFLGGLFFAIASVIFNHQWNQIKTQLK